MSNDPHPDMPTRILVAEDSATQAQRLRHVLEQQGYTVAIASNGRRYWAGVFLKGPDRTPATAAIKSVSRNVLDARRTRVVVRWGGADRRLQVLTSGLRYFQMQRRVNGRAWYTYPITTSTSMTRRWVRGNTIEFRVRARDKAGNWGTWKTVTIKP